jgi:hypothetical protein
MVRRSRLLLAAAALLPACAVPGPTSAGTFARAVELPADVAAAVCAGALRQALPFADPLPYAAGAPATRIADGEFVVRYELRADATWVPCAEHRLRVTQPTLREGPAQPRVLVAPAADMTGAGAASRGAFELHVRGSAGRAELRGELPPDLAADLQSRLDRALAIATRTCAGDAAAGLGEPNLAAFVAWRSIETATSRRAAGDLGGCQAALQTAVNLGASDPTIDRQILGLAADQGEGEQVVDRLRHAAAADGDPAARAATMRRARRAGERPEGRAPLRRSALDCLLTDDLPNATWILHTIRRASRDPADDYRLLRELNQRRDDPMRALAYSLLAREHDPDGAASRTFAADLAAAGLVDLGRRAAEPKLPIQQGAARAPLAGRLEPAVLLASPPR